MTAQLDTAVAQKDLKALERIKLEVAQRELTGTQFCGEHVVGEGTMVDAYVRSQSQDAFAVRWLDREPGMAVHTAIFTSGGRCVVKDGDMQEDGKSIAAVMPNSLAVSRQHGLVAYEAEYWNSPFERFGGGAPHRGLFIENRFVADLDPHKASVPFSLNVNEDEGDFRWNDQAERIDIKPGVALAPAATPPPAPATTPTPAPKQPPAGCVDTTAAKPKKPQVGLRPPAWVQKHLDQVARETGVKVDPNSTKEAQKPQPCPAAPASPPAAK